MSHPKRAPNLLTDRVTFKKSTGHYGLRYFSILCSTSEANARSKISDASTNKMGCESARKN
jgi:hypothetical protein